MLFDSHCHLPFNKEQANMILESAKAEDVVKVVNIGTSLEDSKKALEVSKWFDNVYPTLAVYPHEDRDKDIDSLKIELEKLLRDTKKFVAVGECGIDISENPDGRPISEQIELFEMQIKLALDHNLPIIIHNRNADEQVIELLNKYKSAHLSGVAHCFASSWKTAQKYMDLNFYISFSGLITYPSRKSLLETVKNIPLDRFVVETDAPYLPPQGHRGEKNEPKYVRMIAQKVSEVKECPFDTICQNSYKNTHSLFNISNI
jgi:TatD DNase family protein